MAGYLDYSPIQLTDTTEGVRRLGDALTSMMKRRQDQAQFEQNLQFQREQEQRRYRQQEAQNAYQNRIIDQREQRDQRDFAQRQNEYRSRQSERARHAASPQEAEAILNDTALYDPATGKETARGKLEAGPMRDIGPEPQAPVAPGMPPEIAARFRGRQAPQPEAGALVGPIPSAEEQRSAVMRDLGNASIPELETRMQDAEAQRQADEAQRKRYQTQFESFSQEMPEFGPTAADAEYDKAGREFKADQASFPGRQMAYEAARRGAEADRPYTIKFGDQAGATFDFKTQRTAARETAAQDFLASLPPNMSDADRAAAAQIHAGIQSGTIDPSKAGAMFQKERLTASGEAFKGSEGDKNRANRLEIAKIPKPGITIQERRLGFEGQKEQSKNLRSDLKTFAERYGAKTIQEDNLQIPRIIKDLQGNAQQQRNAMVQLWQMAQHDHRFSDKDAIMAQTVDPSWLAKISNWVSLGTTGNLDPDVQAEAIQTAKSFGSYLSTKSQQMRDMADRDFIQSGLYDRHEADVLLGQQIPGWARQFKDRGGPPEVNSRRKGKEAASRKVTAPSVDEALKALEGM